MERVNNIICGPKLNIPIDGRGLGRTVFDKMQEYGDRVFQINADDYTEGTFEEVNKKCVRLALELKKRNLKKDDIVMVCTESLAAGTLPVYSTLYVNAITTTLPSAISIKEGTHCLQMVPPKIIFVLESDIEFIEAVLSQVDIEPEIIVIGAHEKYLTLSDLLNPHPDEDVFVPDYVNNIHDTAIIFFTSGTTGLPKGACCSSYFMLHACYRLSKDAIDLNAILIYNSLAWITGFVIATSGLLAGAKRVVELTFSPETFVKWTQKYNISFVFLSTLYALRFNEENTKDFRSKSLAEIRIGGSIISAKQVQKLRNFFPNTRIYTVYGLTEVSGIITTFNKFSDSLSIVKSGSCGLPCCDTKIKIVDLETRKTLEPNEKGEICLKVESIFNGYYNRNSDYCFDNDGFLLTGDIGYYDEDNCLYFCDRIKEMFRYENMDIYPAFLEMILCEHPAVSEAIVIGIPDEKDSHRPMGMVALKEGHFAKEEDLLVFINTRLLDREKLIAGLKIIKKFPKTSSGKIPRQIMKQMVLSGDIDTLYIN